MSEPPRQSRKQELAHAAVEGIAGMVPVVGSPIAIALGVAMGWAHSKRMQAWFEEVAEAISDLQERTGSHSWDELREDDVFVDAVMNSTRAALATHQREKLDALRNGVLHTLSPDAPSLDEQARFFRLVEQLTPSHLRLLALLDDPTNFYVAAGLTPEKGGMMGSRSAVVEGIAEFTGRRDWYDLLAKDLADAALTNVGSFHATMSAAGAWESGTSLLGQRFLAFIAEPE